MKQLFLTYLAAFLPLAAISTKHGDFLRLQLVNQDKIGSWGIEASQAAKKYLQTIDKCGYQECWSQCDPLFQEAVFQAEWVKDLKNSRENLGPIISRQIKAQRLVWDPDTFPQGPYIVIDYSSSFKKKSDLQEIITLRRGVDDKWRILMYRIQNP